MSAYYTNEAAFELLGPPVADHSVTTLQLATPSGGALLFEIHRRAVPEGKTLGDIVKEHLAEVAVKRRGHGVLFQREREAAGVLAVEIGSRARGDGGMVFTHEAVLIAGELALVFSGSVLFDEQEACSAYLTAALDTLRLRD